jgi:uncharacterized peroxidase-related enzyme
MPRLKPLDPETATGESRSSMERARAIFGAVPNMMRTFANSPAVLNAYLDFHQALGRGELTAKMREQIAVVAEVNDCEYCLSAHTAIAKLYGATEAELLRTRRLSTGDAKTDAALRLAREIVVRHGRVEDRDLDSARDAGLSDAEVTEIVANVGVNIFTNYFNHVSQTEVDFPRVAARSSSSSAA